MPQSTSTILVTGGAGFIGSHVAEALLTAGHRVVVFDDLSGGFRDNVPAEATFIEGSITDVKAVTDLFSCYQFDYVYHLAAYAAEGLSYFIKRFNYENNLIGSVNLINAAVNTGVKCFVFTSSIAIYGAQEPPFMEALIPQPEDPYGIAKYAVEMDLRMSKELWGMDYVIFRPHNVYGERQNIGDRYRNVIGIFMNQIMKGESLTIFGDGTQTRAFTHIADVAPIIARAAFEPRAYNQVFNIGAEREYGVNELAQTVQKVMGATGVITHLPARREAVHAFSSHERVKEVFGYESCIELEEGIRRMAAWAQQIGSRPASIFKNIEVEKELPPAWRITA